MCTAPNCRRLLLACLMWLALMALSWADTPRTSASPADYARAIDLVHADNGNRLLLAQAIELARELRRKHPGGGYAEAILAEALSTWELDDQGGPESVRLEVLQLVEAALKLNPRLADAHVARARALVRSDRFDEAEGDWEAALRLQPDSAGALFVQADALRRLQREEDAELAYLGFIAAARHPARKANGHAWIARMYEALARRSPSSRPGAIARARQAHVDGLALDPRGPWRLVNFAIFLNSLAEDHRAAEEQARKALAEMEFPMARFHLAAAQYLQVLNNARSPRALSLADSVRRVETDTGVSLDGAIAFQGFGTALVLRLSELQARAAQNTH